MQEESTAYILFRQGRFIDAMKALRSTDDPSLALEIRYFLGAPLQLRAEGKKILQSRSSSKLCRARTLRVLGGQLRDEGAVRDAANRFRSAIEELAGETAPLERALNLCALLECECDTEAFDASRPNALHARREALRSGDPVVLAITHHTFGRLEARLGSYDRALRHFAMARRNLVEAPSLYLEAAVDLDESSTRSLQGEFEEAFALARSALRSAEISGWSKGIAAAATNGAFFSTILGSIDEANSYIAVAERQAFSSTNYKLALVETRAQIALAARDYTSATAILRSHDHLSQEAASWYSLAIAETEIRILCRQQKWLEAIKRADEALSIATKNEVRPYLVSLKLRKALATAANGGKLKAADIPFSAEWADWSLNCQGLFWLVRAVASGSIDHGSMYAQRALHIYQGAGDRGAECDAEELIAAKALKPSHPKNLDSAVALIEVAGHPQVLAREAFALIQGTGCVDHATLVSRGAKAVHVLATHGWGEREAQQAARRTDAVDSIDCGTHRGETLHIIARPADDLERRCVWIAVKKLVATALTLDQYRRDEKQRAALWPTESLEGDPDIIWVSEPVNEVVRVARRIGPTMLSVLLTGETGTGKEMLARTIHLSSTRADRILLAFNCTAVPRDMLESQLFGYRKGAFTGADTSFTGVIRAAEGGTLFLDEVADMPVDVQPKLLRFLETHEIHPLGEPHPTKVDVRVIAATNANLEQLVAEGRFRQDLYYRLNVVRLRLPPLRERREEIPALVEHFVRRYADQQKKGRLTLADDALEYLLLYTWPGNLRQLANEVNRMVAMAEPDSALTAAHLSAEIQATRRTIASSAAPDSELRISMDQSLPDAVEQLERTMVQNALDRTNGRLEDAAKILGISRKGLFLKRRRWGLQG
jgi:DNA-binding NtrC family response regulator/tetratricopeptide (TPR) repeat protein